VVDPRLIAQSLQQVDVLVVADQDVRVAPFEAVGQLRRRVEEVVWNVDAAGQRDGVAGDDELCRGRQHRRHAVAGLDAAVLQRRGQRLDVRAQALVAVVTAALDDSLLRVLLGRPQEKFVDGMVRVRFERGVDAEGLVLRVPGVAVGHWPVALVSSRSHCLLVCAAVFWPVFPAP